MQIPDDSDEGYILEVNLKYPKELHDLHNDYPLASEKMKILSPFCKARKCRSPETSTQPQR
jgi:hypothetical protein